MACFRESLAARGADSQVFAIDAGSSAPAAFVAGQATIVPRSTDPGFVDAVLRVCAEQNVALLVPTIDTELAVYAASAKRFADAGVTVSISSPAVIEICGNKRCTHEWLQAHGFPTVRQTDPHSAAADAAAWPLPLIAKPFNGSASIGIRRIETQLDLAALLEGGGSYVVQEIARGREFTVNAYVNRQGKCVCAVPHWRMEVRAGEVSKGITVKDHRLMDMAARVVEALPGAFGALNIQCFMDDAGDIRIIEINARFGGGYPLAHRAGARFTGWLLDELEGRRVAGTDEWMDDLAMLRYDEAVFVPGSRILS